MRPRRSFNCDKWRHNSVWLECGVGSARPHDRTTYGRGPRTHNLVLPVFAMKRRNRQGATMTDDAVHEVFLSSCFSTSFQCPSLAFTNDSLTCVGEPGQQAFAQRERRVSGMLQYLRSHSRRRTNRPQLPVAVVRSDRTVKLTLIGSTGLTFE